MLAHFMIVIKSLEPRGVPHVIPVGSRSQHSGSVVVGRLSGYSEGKGKGVASLTGKTFDIL